MCLPIDFWLCCMPRTIDDDPAPASRTRNGGSHYNGSGGYPAHSKASNDVRRVPAHHHAAVVPRGWHGHAPAPTTGAQEKMAAAYPYAGANETLKQQHPAPAAWNGRVAAAADGHAARGGAAHSYYSYQRAQPPAAAHREDAANSHYAAANATARARVVEMGNN